MEEAPENASCCGRTGSKTRSEEPEPSGRWQSAHHSEGGRFREQRDKRLAERLEVAMVLGRDVETGGEGGRGDLYVQRPGRLAHGLRAAIPSDRRMGQDPPQTPRDQRGTAVEGDDREHVAGQELRDPGRPTRRVTGSPRLLKLDPGIAAATWLTMSNGCSRSVSAFSP